jgi:hypothetical protein
LGHGFLKANNGPFSKAFVYHNAQFRVRTANQFS